MKTIAEAISRLKEKSRRDLLDILETSDDSSPAIKERLLSIGGLNRILTLCSPEELAIVQALYSAGGPLTFGDLEKRLDLATDDIETMTTALADRLLVYVIKNRQLLTNKMDKVYPVQEIGSILRITPPERPVEHARALAEALHKEGNRLKTPATRQKLLHLLMDRGGCAPVDELMPVLSAAEWNAVEEMAEEGLLAPCHILSPEFHTIICVEPHAIPPSSSRAGEGQKIHNGYLLAHDLLRSYDTISTNGLFYTKQDRFRRIDLKRIADSLIPLRDTTGKVFDSEVMADLCLHLLHRLGCLSLKRDVAEITLKGIRKDIRNPAIMTSRVINSLDPSKSSAGPFRSPVTLPSPRCLKGIMRVLWDMQRADSDTMRWILLAYFLGDSQRQPADFRLETVSEEWSRVGRALDFLCMAGMCDMEGGTYVLSDAGRETSGVLLRLPADVPAAEITKSLYINPDFSVIIPAGEIPSSLLYTILGYVTITQEDVMLHGMVTRASIIRAEKRGMPVRIFLETLESCSRNEIPRNLHFVLNEWAGQTMKVVISSPVLLHCTHPVFIDELLYGEMKDAVVERITPNHVLIRQENIEEIVRLARKKEAVLSVFEE